MRWLADLPTTNLRIVVTLLVFIGTAIAYGVSGKPPSEGWMMFLLAMAGVDALSKIGVRATTKPDAIRAEGEAAVRKIEATAAAVPPLTPNAAIKAGRTADPESSTPLAAKPEIVAVLERQLDATRHPTDTMSEEGE